MKKETTLKDTRKAKVINKEDEQDLINFINNIPTKYGLPLLKFLDGLKEQ